MGTTLGLVTWTVKNNSASRDGKVSLRFVRLIEMRLNLGSFGFAMRKAAVAVAVAAPIRAEAQCKFVDFLVSME